MANMDEITKDILSEEKEIYKALETIVEAHKTLSSHGYEMSIRADDYRKCMLKAKQRMTYLTEKLSDNYKAKCLECIEMLEKCYTTLPSLLESVTPIRDEIECLKKVIETIDSSQDDLLVKNRQNEITLFNYQNELTKLKNLAEEMKATKKSQRQHDLESTISKLNEEIRNNAQQMEEFEKEISDKKEELKYRESDLKMKTEKCPCEDFLIIKKKLETLKPPQSINRRMCPNYTFELVLLKEYGKPQDMSVASMQSKYSIKVSRDKNRNGSCSCRILDTKCACCLKILSFEYEECSRCDDGGYI